MRKTQPQATHKPFTPKDAWRIQHFVDTTPNPTPRQKKFKATVMKLAETGKKK